MKKHISKKINTIVLSTGVVIFSLAAAFSGTIAWFNTTKAATVNAGTFQVTAGEGIQFDLYYLHHFAVDKNGNYNFDTGLYAGYELAAANPVFYQVEYDNEGNIIDDDPINISHLWPNHRVTYAIVVTSGELSNFSLSSWVDNRSADVKTQVNSQDVEISLSWATNMYGGAYYVASTNVVANDIATGFSSYVSDNTVTDKFLYSQTNIAPDPKPSITIVDSVSGESGNDQRVILYFSIEFSNSSDTFYIYNNPYYEKNALGNSNCYETLSLSNLAFRLV